MQRIGTTQVLALLVAFANMGMPLQICHQWRSRRTPPVYVSSGVTWWHVSDATTPFLKRHYRLFPTSEYVTKKVFMNFNH
jgi:hypothetical protein